MTDEKHQDLDTLGPWGHAAALSFRFLFAIACLIACGWLGSNIQQIPADSQALVMRFGTVARTHGSGLLVAWPRPIEQVVVVPAAARQFELKVRRFMDEDAGFVSTQGFFASTDPRRNGGFLLTGDGGVVHLEASVFYQIDDPLAYTVAAAHIDKALERLVLASAVTLIAGRDLDSVLVARPEVAAEVREATRRERLRSELQSAVNERLEVLKQRGANLGITVSRVDLVPSIPAGAKEAFDNVLVVTQQAEAGAAMARTSAQMTSQEANRNKDRIAANAAASAEETITLAKTQTAPVLALEQQSHGMSRNMLVTRVYYDHVGPLLKRARGVSVIDRTGTVHTIVPGESR